MNTDRQIVWTGHETHLFNCKPRQNTDRQIVWTGHETNLFNCKPSHYVVEHRQTDRQTDRQTVWTGHETHLFNCKPSHYVVEHRQTDRQTVWTGHETDLFNCKPSLLQPVDMILQHLHYSRLQSNNNTNTVSTGLCQLSLLWHICW